MTGHFLLFKARFFICEGQVGVFRLEGSPLDPLARVVTLECFRWRVNPRCGWSRRSGFPRSVIFVASAGDEMSLSDRCIMMDPTLNIFRCFRPQKIRTPTILLHGHRWRARPSSLSTPFSTSSNLFSIQPPPSRTCTKCSSIPIELQPTYLLRQNKHRPGQVYPHRKQTTHKASHRYHRQFSRVSAFGLLV